MSENQRIRNTQLCKDITVILHYTCTSLVELTNHMLEEKKYEYVCLCTMFSTDPLKKSFLKFRQGSWRNIFIKAQQGTEKLAIGKTKLQTTLNHEKVESLIVQDFPICFWPILYLL